jgi:hypothetical protein
MSLGTNALTSLLIHYLKFINIAMLAKLDAIRLSQTVGSGALLYAHFILVDKGTIIALPTAKG